MRSFKSLIFTLLLIPGIAYAGAWSIGGVTINLRDITLLNTGCINIEDAGGTAVGVLCLDGSDDLNLGDATGVDNMNFDIATSGVFDLQINTASVFTISATLADFSGLDVLTDNGKFYQSKQSSGSTVRNLLGFSTDVVQIGALTNDLDILGLTNFNISSGTGTNTLVEVQAATARTSELRMAGSDVAGPATAFIEADNWLRWKPISGTAGGASLTIASDTDAAPFIGLAIFGSANPTDATPAWQFRCAISDGATGIAALAALETCFQISAQDGGTDFVTVTGDGHLGLGDTTPAEGLLVLAPGAVTGLFLNQDNDNISLDIDSESTTATVFAVNGDPLTTGAFITAQNTITADGLTNRTTSDNLIDFSVSRTESRTSATTADDFDLMSLSRTSVTTGIGGTLTAAGSVLKLENTSTQTNGTLTDTVAVLEVVQNATSTGLAIDVSGGDIQLANTLSYTIKDAGGSKIDIVTLDGNDDLFLGDATGVDNIVFDVATSGTFSFDVNGTPKITIDSTGVMVMQQYFLVSGNTGGLGATTNTAYSKGLLRISRGADYIIQHENLASDTATFDISVIAQAAKSDASTNIDGGDINLTAGAGASGSGSDADGGNIVLTGGAGFGTGIKGIIDIQSAATITSDVTTQDAFAITADTLTTGNLLIASNIITANGLTNRSAGDNLVDIAVTRVDSRTTGTTVDDFDLMSLARTQEASGGGGTLTAAGSVLKIENIATASAGTLTDTVAVLELVQDTDSTGITLSVDSNGANTKPIMALENTAGDIEIFRTDATPESAVTGSIGDLAIDGTNGILYIKNTGSATNTGWEPLSTVDAYSSMWFHGAPTTVTISAQNAFTKMTLFVNVGAEDVGGNVVGDATTDDDFTINLAGTYDIDIQGSFTNGGGGSVEFQMAPKVILNSAKTITDATDVSPIVITSNGHNLKSGDGVIQSGVVGNTAANGDFYITVINANSYSLQTLAHVNVAGNGAYTSGGTVTAVIPGNIIMERIVSNTDLGRGAASGTFVLAVGDILEAVAVNEDSTDDLSLEQVQFGIRRIGN